MVLGFALCTTFAFAQTAGNQPDLGRNRAVKPSIKDAGVEQVNYKASIFSKDNVFDTIRVFRFNDADMAQITYGDIASTDHLKNQDGSDSVFGTNCHTVSLREQSWSRWHRFADSAEFKDSIWDLYPTWIARFFCIDAPTGDTDYTWVLDRIGASNNEGDAGYQDDGFMFFGYDFNPGLSSNKIVNTYFTLPTVTRTLPQGDRVVLIGVNQGFYKFADQCHIDYKIGNDWYTREINVSGIDVDLNSAAASKVQYVMPYNMKNQTEITLRVRVYAKKYATYGYGWFLDNLAIVTDNRTQSWSFNTGTALDGFYGTMPQGMTIPMSYGVHVRNTNITPLANTTLTITNAPENGNWTVAATSTPYTVPTGNTLQDYKLWINERGFMCTSSRIDTNFNWGAHSFLGRFANYHNQGALTGGFLGRSLNTETIGANFYAVKAECDTVGGGKMTRELDTVLYTVSDDIEFLDEGDSNRVNGYRWGRDNGIVPSNSAFGVAYTETHYITQEDDDQHAFDPGYEIVVRYVTGSEVPENWVFRGIEYVPATDMQNPLDMTTESGVLMPIIFEEVPDGEGGTDWVELSAGIDNLLFPITEDAVNNLPSTYALPGDNYSALNVKFLDEITLKKNTSYLIGYVLYRAAQFRVASQSASYRDGNSSVRYRDNEATKAYARQNTPAMPYDVLVRDAAGSSSDGDHWIMGWNCNTYPMIRPIVGTPSPVDRVPVVGRDCSTNDTLGVTITRGLDDVCFEPLQVAVGSSQSFSIEPIGDHTYINHIYVNGVEAEVYNEEGDAPANNFWLYEHDANVHDPYPYDTSNIILYRNSYTLHFSGIQNSQEPYVITVDYDWHAWDLSGIDPVAPESYLSLSPNPATSSVKLNVAGVTGMVNCSIIDMSGRVVYNRNINAEAETTINVSNMPAGAYFVRVTNDTFSKIEKLIIK